MTNCWIFDDIYWERIYRDLKEILPNFNYPITTNVDNPIPYIWEIKDWDFIILDNFFFWEWREQPLWDDFLRQYLKLHYKCKIVCISNYWERNIIRFSQWNNVYNKWDIIGFVPDKNPREISRWIMYNLEMEKIEKTNSNL